MSLWGKKKDGQEPSTREKKKGPIRRLWRKIKGIDWKNPVNRWKLLLALLLTIIIGGSAFAGILTFTNSPVFCKSCHEMKPEYATFQASAHNQITCVQCHIKPGTVNMLTHKMKSMKEVYYHITGVPEQIVQTAGEAVTNVNCLQCHSKNRLVTASGDLKVNHDGHIKENIPCITCHAGVAHAKIATRDINTEKERSLWTPVNTEKLMAKEYMDPNMGTCIDCHDKVNKGEKPWKDVAYSIPPQEEHGAKKEAHAGESHPAEPTQAEKDQKTQEIILQAIGHQKQNVKLSMECSTCHREIKVPNTHKASAWDHNHGGSAIQEVDKCVDCHQDTKWVKEMTKQDIMTLLNDTGEKEKYTPNLTVVKENARINQFCSTCHANRPPGHLDSDQWLTKHAGFARTNEDKAQCFVCHDKDKPLPDTKEEKAPTDVYCQYCHRTGFKGGN